MKATLKLVVFLAASGYATVAFAEGPVKLPATAKLLNKAEIIALYGGTSADWDHPNTDKVKGTVTVNADVSASSGTFVDGKNKGEWEAKLTFKGDQYCWSARQKGKGKYGKPVCNLIYADGKTAYEVHPKNKKILSVNTIK